MDLFGQAIFGLAAMLMAALLSHAVCLFVVRQRLGLDPVSHRSNHNVPTPRTGGLAIILGTTGASAILVTGGLLGAEARLLFLFAAGAGALGLADDFYELPPLPKLMLLTALATGAALMLGPIPAIPVPFAGWVALPYPAALVLTVFWLVGIVNVVNFMDGLNGLIGGFGVLILGVLSMSAGDLAWPLIAVQAAGLGFLLCNAFKGRVFLGDGGSLALGFLIGAAPLAAGEAGAVSIWLVALVGLPLIGDVALTLLRRARRGERLTEAHREHLYQQLKAAGWSHQAVAISLLVLGAAAFMLALMFAPAYSKSAELYWLLAAAILTLWALIVFGMFRLKPGTDAFQ